MPATVTVLAVVPGATGLLGVHVSAERFALVPFDELLQLAATTAKTSAVAK